MGDRVDVCWICAGNGGCKDVDGLSHLPPCALAAPQRCRSDRVRMRGEHLVGRGLTELRGGGGLDGRPHRATAIQYGTVIGISDASIQQVRVGASW